jgi:hypothetical protein
MRKGREYWSPHIAKLLEEGISSKAYAERESLPLTSVYYWRRRLTGSTILAVQPTGVKSSSTGFLAVRVAQSYSEPASCTLVIAPGMRLELSQLPTPLWLAELGSTLCKRGCSCT